jgi:exosortase
MVMSGDQIATAPIDQSLGGPPSWMGVLRDWWFLAIAVIVFALPGLIQLGQTVWSTEQGAHGPIILSTGLWLLLRESAGIECRSGSILVIVAMVTIGMAGFLFGSVAGMLWLQWGSTYLVLLGVLHAFIGGAGMRRLWFPLFYLAFLIPLPFTVLNTITGELRLLISARAVDILSLFGFQVASSGVSLYVDQYELLVAAACSGMNSIVSLLAIGLFYIYLRHRAHWHYAVLLGLLVIPIAILANLVRVMILMLITHYGGLDAAEGMLHEAAGMVMFFVALFTLIAADALLDPVRRFLSVGKAVA